MRQWRGASFHIGSVLAIAAIQQAHTSSPVAVQPTASTLMLRRLDKQGKVLGSLGGMLQLDRKKSRY